MHKTYRYTYTHTCTISTTRPKEGLFLHCVDLQAGEQALLEDPCNSF